MAAEGGASGAPGGKGSGSSRGAELTSPGGVVALLENTLWNRQLGAMSEELVAALVCQIFEGVPHAQLWLCSYLPYVTLLIRVSNYASESRSSPAQ